ncbi:sensor histidine kinase [Actinomadura verrucosospora]|uniref:Oxygen sensor histidine kinase NreB n=1 Tax=Actinomadura verrucosospora TaxID=46165 RepID=A0A7D3VX02_ACTVE|nr:sensor histidine kinase [Actinomadura verrucosospora]QKG25875.1 putative two-component system sensor kinase [Actinomadura verrucosospora]
MRAPAPALGRAASALRLLPRGRRADALLAAACFAVLTVVALIATQALHRGTMVFYGWALLAVACGALVFRRSRPRTVAVVTFVACAVYYPVTEPDGPIIMTFVIALYTAAAQGHLATASGLAAVAMGATLYGNDSDNINHLADAATFLLAGWFVAVIAIGGLARNRRAYLREAERRVAAAERSREEEARRRASEERLRIARELHDALGHNISLIHVQATAALHVLEREPGRAGDALTAIKDASKDSLRELRATLGVLRQVDEPAGPGLGRLGELVAGSTAAGLTVRTETEGAPRPLPPDTDHAAYRIVQEALTNVTRHSGAASAVVRVRYGDDDVTVTVEDDGGGAPAPAPAGTGTGSGIRGMRDRAEALGGTLDAAPRPGGGFTVRATLPA